MPHYHYRCAHIDDVDALFQLNCDCFTESWSKASLLQVMQAGFDAYVAVHQGKCIAYILSQDILDEVHIMQLAVTPEHRRQGIAKMLIQTLLKDKSSHAQWALLEVRASNEAAQNLYQHLGFAIIGTRPRYYTPTAPQQPREDAIIMHYDFEAHRVNE